MDKKTVAIIITVIACLLCLCPGLTGALMGIIFALVSFMPGANIDMMGSSDPRSALSFGIWSLVIGVVMTVVGAVIIFLAWKKKKNAV